MGLTSIDREDRDRRGEGQFFQEDSVDMSITRGRLFDSVSGSKWDFAIVKWKRKRRRRRSRRGWRPIPLPRNVSLKLIQWIS